jgi:hypothetical protein
MAQYSSISDLAQAVLDSVMEDEAVKTASETAPITLKTEIGNELKKVAEHLRATPSLSISNEDLVTATKTAGVSADLKEMPEAGSAVGNELRKIANSIRHTGSVSDDTKTAKIAQIITAAVGLKHLTGGIEKEAVSLRWITNKTVSGAENATAARIRKSMNKHVKAEDALGGSNGLPALKRRVADESLKPEWLKKRKAEALVASDPSNSKKP